MTTVVDTGVRLDKVDPVNTPTAGLRAGLVTTIAVELFVTAVQLYQTVRELIAPNSAEGSPGSLLAATVRPFVLAGSPARLTRLLKSSFTGRPTVIVTGEEMVL